MSFVFVLNANAQNAEKSDYFIEGGVRYGTALQHPNSYPEDPVAWDRHLYDLYFGSFEIRFGKQMRGYNAWERILNNPIFGVALRFTDYTDYTDPTELRKSQAAVLGQNIALFGYLQHPIVRIGKFSWHYQVGMGAAAFTKIYNAETNPDNHWMSLYINPYVNFQSGFDFNFTLLYGVKFFLTVS